VKEFLEFYSLDYTKNIYCPEVNIRPENAMKREEISQKSGLNSEVKDKPLLVQLLENYLAGGKGEAQGEKSALGSIEPLHEIKKASPRVAESQPIQHIDKANELLDDLHQEEEKGYAINSGSKKQEAP